MKICVWLVAELVILGHCDQTSKARGKVSFPSFMSIGASSPKFVVRNCAITLRGEAAFSWLGGVSSPVAVSSEG